MMTRVEFIALGKMLFGRNWQKVVAERLKVDGSSVRRWSSGAVPVPGPVQAAMRAWAETPTDPGEGTP